MDPANQYLYEALGALIRRRRRALDLTQDKLAGRLGISRGALANIETGRQNILLHQLVRLAAALEMDIHELLPVQQKSADADQSKDLPLPKGLTAEQKTQVAQLLTQELPRKPIAAKRGSK
jgi:transcriptional regulator with XRE-family HTH domain